MKKILLLLCAFFAVSINVNAIEKYEQEWLKSYGGTSEDYFNDIIETSDGGFLALGNSESTDAGFTPKGNTDGLVVKIDKDGNQEWIKNYGGNGIEDLKRIIKTKDGKYFLIGLSESTDAGFTSKGRADAVIIKIDKDGNQEWIKNYGGSNQELFNDVIATDDGYILVGMIKSTDAGVSVLGGCNALAIKIDDDGNQQWIKSAGGDNMCSNFYAITKANDGNYIAVGDSSSKAGSIISNGNYDILAVKFDEDGNNQWEKNYGGSDYEGGTDVIATGTEYLIVGHSESPDNGFINYGGPDIFIQKIDENGNQVFVKTYGGSNIEAATKIIEGEDGNYLISGYGMSTDGGYEKPDMMNGLIIEIDAAGVYKNIISYETINIFSGIIKSNSGLYYLPGYTLPMGNSQNIDNSDAMILKLNLKSKVIYDANGGTGSLPATHTGYSTTKYNVEFTPAPTKKGYTFIGWSDGTKTYLADGSTNNEITLTKNDVVLKAVYKKDTVEVIDDKDDNDNKDNNNNDKDLPDTGVDLSHIIILLVISMGLVITSKRHYIIK